VTQYLVPLDETDPAGKAGLYLERCNWWWGGENDGAMVCVSILGGVTAAFGLVAVGFNIWGAPQDSFPWWLVLPAILWCPIFILGGYALERYGKRHALAIPNEQVRYDAYGDRVSVNSHIIAEGRNAYHRMEPILQEGARPIYDKMYASLARYHIANEDLALHAASKRAQLLKDIAAEGRLTRAANIDITNEDDLKFGRTVVEQMQLTRRELEA
jgi:hypothetical protein